MDKNFSCGNRIKELRTERALSQERLALNAGITPVYLGQVERGQKNATVNTIEQICKAMNISLAEFFGTADENSSEDDFDKQVMSQLSGLNKKEKAAIFQLIKSALQFRSISISETTDKEK